MNDLTVEEIQAIIPLIDIGIKTAGIQVFQNEGGVKIQSALKKFQEMADRKKPDASD